MTINEEILYIKKKYAFHKLQDTNHDHAISNPIQSIESNN